MASEYLNFVENTPPDRKTEVWEVQSKSSGALLGIIKWYGPWRQYSFFPEPVTIFNKGCLEDINKFMGELMDAWRNG